MRVMRHVEWPRINRVDAIDHHILYSFKIKLVIYDKSFLVLLCVLTQENKIMAVPSLVSTTAIVNSYNELMKQRGRLHYNNY